MGDLIILENKTDKKANKKKRGSLEIYLGAFKEVLNFAGIQYKQVRKGWKEIDEQKRIQKLAAVGSVETFPVIKTGEVYVKAKTRENIIEENNNVQASEQEVKGEVIRLNKNQPEQGKNDIGVEFDDNVLEEITDMTHDVEAVAYRFKGDSPKESGKKTKEVKLDRRAKKAIEFFEHKIKEIDQDINNINASCQRARKLARDYAKLVEQAGDEKIKSEILSKIEDEVFKFVSGNYFHDIKEGILEDLKSEDNLIKIYSSQSQEKENYKDNFSNKIKIIKGEEVSNEVIIDQCIDRAMITNRERVNKNYNFELERNVLPGCLTEDALWEMERSTLKYRFQKWMRQRR